MEALGSGYLYTLAAISITFAGFAMLTVVLRQMMGGGLSGFDVFFVRVVLARGFMVAGCAMLPPLLSLLELSDPSMWRLSSLIAAVAQGVFLLTWIATRRSATKIPISKMSLALYFVQWAPAVFLLMIAMQIFFRPTVGLFAAGLSAITMLGFVAYFVGMRVLLLGNTKPKNADK